MTNADVVCGNLYSPFLRLTSFMRRNQQLLQETAGEHEQPCLINTHFSFCEGGKHNRMTTAGAVRRSRAGRVLKPVSAWWLGKGKTGEKREKLKNRVGVKTKCNERRKKRSVLEIGELVSETEGSMDRRKRQKIGVEGGDCSGDDCSWNWPVREVDDELVTSPPEHSTLPWH